MAFACWFVCGWVGDGIICFDFEHVCEIKENMIIKLRDYNK